MNDVPSIAEVGALVGDPVRSNILMALMSGQALTAGELAKIAHVAPSTTSQHLAKLLDGRLVAVAAQGRHRYYRLASPGVAAMLEAISRFATEGPRRYQPPSIRDRALRAARTCYDHLAGQLGVAIADTLCAHHYIALDADGGTVSDSGHRFLESFGLSLGRARPVPCKACLDWSERRWHVGGRLGAGLAERCFDLGWIERRTASRVVRVTQKGTNGFREVFGIDIPHLADAEDKPGWTWNEAAR